VPDPQDPRDGTPPGGVPQWQGAGYRPSARGGHPEQREPGGGWGADGSGQGPGAGFAAGRVLQGTPGRRAGLGRSAPPWQDYPDPFRDDTLGGGGTGSLPSLTPRHPSRAPGPPPGYGSDVRRPGTPGPWNGYGRPAGLNGHVNGHGQAGSEPWQRQYRDAVDAVDVEPDELVTTGQRRAVPGHVARTKKSGKGRALTGVLAAAVTTVLAVVIAGQVTGGDFGDSGASDKADVDDRGKSADDGPVSRSEKGGGARNAVPRAASYTELMSKTFPLSADFKGKGSFAPVKGEEKGPGGGKALRYRVDVEKGLPLESKLFADAVHKTLNDKRSWAHDGERSFERVEGGDADFVITLASAPTTDVWCAKSGLDTSVDRVSCDSASTERVMINAYRWAGGAKTFGDDKMFSYRQMLINHEVGHRLGFDHVGCPKDGALAPVMMQQSKTLKTGRAECRPNAWPHPRG
jgi:hypothetical protein